MFRADKLFLLKFCVCVCECVHLCACVCMCMCLYMLCLCVFITCVFTTWNLFLSHFSNMLIYGFEFYSTVLKTPVKTPINCLNSIYIFFQVTINANFIMIYLLKPSWLMPKFLVICFYCLLLIFHLLLLWGNMHFMMISYIWSSWP